MAPNAASPVYTRLARLATWLLLTGFVFLPTGHIRPASGPSAETPSQLARGLIFPIMVLPPLCCFLGTVGIVVLAILRHSDYLWLSTHLLVPALAASLASLALVFYLVYKDGWVLWTRMETIAAIVAAVYSAAFIAATVVVGRKCRRELERQGEERLEEGGRSAPQIPEVELVTSLNDELLPSSQKAS